METRNINYVLMSGAQYPAIFSLMYRMDELAEFIIRIRFISYL